MQRVKYPAQLKKTKSNCNSRLKEKIIIYTVADFIDQHIRESGLQINRTVSVH